MSANSWPWNELGLRGKSDKKSIMAAYAAKLKSINRDDPEAFARLQNARKAALAFSGVDKNRAARRPTMKEAASGELDLKHINHTTNYNFESSQVDKSPEIDTLIKSSEQESAVKMEIVEKFDQAREHSGASSLKNPWDKTDPESRSALDQFWQEYQKALNSENFDVAAKLLRLPVAENKDVRLHAERIAFRKASQVYGFRTRDLALLEDEFHWVTDRFSIENRLGKIHAPLEFWERLHAVYYFAREESSNDTASRPKVHTKKPILQKSAPIFPSRKERIFIWSFTFVFINIFGLLIQWYSGQNAWFLIETISLQEPYFFIAQGLLLFLCIILCIIMSYMVLGISSLASILAPKHHSLFLNRALQTQGRYGNGVNWTNVAAYTSIGLLICALGFSNPVLLVRTFFYLVSWPIIFILISTIVISLISIVSKKFTRKHQEAINNFNLILSFVLTALFMVFLLMY